MGFDIPKQYIKIGGKEIIAHTLDIFQSSSSIDEIAVAAEKEYFTLLNEIKIRDDITKLKYIVEGGERRQDSVYNSLKSINAEGDDLVVVHDAARALLPVELLENAVKYAVSKGSALVALNISDTLVEGGSKVEKYPDRERYFRAQTPQIFRFSVLLGAMNKAYSENFYGTDESMLVKNYGLDVNIFPGSPINIKITTKEDLTLLEILLKFKSKL